MKKTFLSLAAMLCFAAAASAQNEVPGAPNTRVSTEEDNVYAPTRIDRRNGEQVPAEQETRAYDERSPQQQPQTQPATVAPAPLPAVSREKPLQKKKKK